MKCSSCARPPYLNLLEDSNPEENLESSLVTETGVTEKELSHFLQQLDDLRWEGNSCSSEFEMLSRNTLGNRGWGALRGKRSFKDLFYGKSKLPPHLAWTWSQDRMQRGKKQELRHLPWQMDLKSPMLRG